MSVTGQLLHGNSWTQNCWLECTIVQSFLSEIFRSLINIPISKGQITNKVKIIFDGRNLQAVREAWRESKGLKDHCPIALCYKGRSIQSSRNQLPFHCNLVFQCKKQHTKRRMRKRSWVWVSRKVEQVWESLGVKMIKIHSIKFSKN